MSAEKRGCSVRASSLVMILKELFGKLVVLNSDRCRATSFGTRVM